MLYNKGLQTVQPLHHRAAILLQPAHLPLVNAAYIYLQLHWACLGAHHLILTQCVEPTRLNPFKRCTLDGMQTACMINTARLATMLRVTPTPQQANSLSHNSRCNEAPKPSPA